MQRERDRETGGKAKSEKKERQNQRVKRVRGTQRESLIDREPGTYRVTEIEIQGDGEEKDKRERDIGNFGQYYQITHVYNARQTNIFSRWAQYSSRIFFFNNLILPPPTP